MHAVTSGSILTTPKMCVDAHVASCARQAFVLAVRNVASRVWVNIFFCKAKVCPPMLARQLGDVCQQTNDGDCGVGLGAGGQEVLWLNISIDDVLRVDILQPRDQLDRQHAHSL